MLHPNCERHRLEANAFPQAQHEGWALKVDFSGLHEHVLGLDNQLRCLLQEENARSNKFYKKIKKSLKGVSMAAAAGVSGQWATFQGHGVG